MAKQKSNKKVDRAVARHHTSTPPRPRPRGHLTVAKASAQLVAATQAAVAATQAAVAAPKPQAEVPAWGSRGHRARLWAGLIAARRAQAEAPKESVAWVLARDRAEDLEERLREFGEIKSR